MDPFQLSALRSTCIGLTSTYLNHLIEAATHCLFLHSHPSPVPLRITGDHAVIGSLDWDQPPLFHEHTWADRGEATEYGAYAVALLVATRLTGRNYVQRSVRSTGIDLWLSSGIDEHGVFQRSARLEVSGIFDGDDKRIAARLERKRLQTQQSDTTSLVAYVVIVEFSSPEARFVARPPFKERTR